jgi:hypothetical protein
LVRPQRIVERTVRARAATDPLRIPLDHFIQKAHAAPMRNARLDPFSIQ